MTDRKPQGSEEPHDKDCLARNESEPDFTLRMANFGPCPCETRIADRRRTYARMWRDRAAKNEGSRG